MSASAPQPPAPRLPPLGGPDAAVPERIALELVNAFSVSGCEGPLADAVQEALEALPHLAVLRHGNTVVARTTLGRAERVVIAGHLDTVPVSERTENVPGRLERREGQEVIWGRGSVDMKGGVAVLLHLAAALSSPSRDVTWVFYDNEEVTSELNGLGRVLRERPQWLEADFAVLAEPTGAQIEGGCNGTLRLILTVHGLAAHSGRSWRGVNAVHAAAPLIERVASAPVREVEVEGLVYREGFSVVDIAAGIAMNTIPDRCRFSVNYRFAPDLSAEEALDRALRILAGLPVEGSGESGGPHAVVDASSTTCPRPPAPVWTRPWPPSSSRPCAPGAGRCAPSTDGPTSPASPDRRRPLLRRGHPRHQPGPRRPHALPHRRRALPRGPDPGRCCHPARLAELARARKRRHFAESTSLGGMDVPRKCRFCRQVTPFPRNDAPPSDALSAK